MGFTERYPRTSRLALVLAALTTSLAIFALTDLDTRLQDRLFNFARGEWLVNRAAPGPRLLFYSGPKWCLVVLGVTLIVMLLVPEPKRPRWLRLPWRDARLRVLAASLVAVPALIGLLKANSQLHCPWAIARYGGEHPYRRVFSTMTPEQARDCGKCFPAGHASGGFALMALYFVLRRRWLGLGLGLAAGWTMGLYQMLKGAHFLSHTVVTMLLAWLLIEAIAAVLRVQPAPTTDCEQETADKRG